jgi:hypothetical protein
MPQRRRKNTSKKRRGKPRSSNSSSMRFMPAVAGPRKNVKLRVITTAIISGAAPAIIKRWNPNSAYVPETGGGSGQTPGYADWAALYGYYRVIKYHFTITVINKEAFDVVTYVINSNNDPTTSNNSTLASNPKAMVRTLSSKGGMDRATFSGGFSIASIVGSKSVLFDDLYSSLINTSPADITWMGVGVQSIGGANLTNGISVTVALEQDTIFYDYLLQIYSQVTPLQAAEFLDQKLLWSSPPKNSLLTGNSSSLSKEEDIQQQQENGVLVRVISPRATPEKELADKKKAFASYRADKGVDPPLSTRVKYNMGSPGSIDFVKVY